VNASVADSPTFWPAAYQEPAAGWSIVHQQVNPVRAPSGNAELLPSRVIGLLKASVLFQFLKGYLASSDFTQIQQTINQVFTIGDDKDAKAQQNAKQAAPQDAQPAGQQSQQAPQAAAAQPTRATIGLGQTTDQVPAPLGQPEKLVKPGDRVL
jgi:hypothetical protein